MARTYKLRNSLVPEGLVLVPITPDSGVAATGGGGDAADGDAERISRACLSNHISTREGVVGVIGAEVFRRDIRLLKGLKPGCRESGKGVKWKPAQRGLITELSSRSRLRLLHTVKNTSVDFRSLATGTYPAQFTTDGREFKRHLEAMLKAVSRRFGREVAYVWFLEFQRRGAPHWHLLLSVSVGPGDRRWLSSTWFRIVASGDPKHLKAGTNFENLRDKEGAAKYVAKYSCKTYQKSVPPEFRNVGRFWGASSNVKPVAIAKVTISAEQVVERLGMQVEKFVSPSGKFRNYLWDQTEKFLEK